MCTGVLRAPELVQVVKCFVSALQSALPLRHARSCYTPSPKRDYEQEMVGQLTTSIHTLMVSSLLPPRRDRLVPNSLQGQAKQEANMDAAWAQLVSKCIHLLSVRLTKTTSGSFAKADLVS